VQYIISYQQSAHAAPLGTVARRLGFARNQQVTDHQLRAKAWVCRRGSFRNWAHMVQNLAIDYETSAYKTSLNPVAGFAALEWSVSGSGCDSLRTAHGLVHRHAFGIDQTRGQGGFRKERASSCSKIRLRPGTNSRRNQEHVR